jgi:hypothetical protein
MTTFKAILASVCGSVFRPASAGQSEAREASRSGAQPVTGPEGRRPSRPRTQPEWRTLHLSGRGRQYAPAIVLLVVVNVLCVASPAMAEEFGIERFAVGVQNESGTPDVQAGSHPYALTTTFLLHEPICSGTQEKRCRPESELRDAKLELPPGLVGDPKATPRCTYQEFINLSVQGGGGCANETAIGVATTYTQEETPGNENEHRYDAISDPVFNLVPPPGVAAEFGYIVAKEVPILLQTGVRTGTDYGLTTSASEIDEVKWVAASKVTIWGVPANPIHDRLRGTCEFRQVGHGVPQEDNQPAYEVAGYGLREGEDEIETPEDLSLSGLPRTRGECKSGAPQVPLLTNPTSCGASRTATLSVDDWKEPGNFTGPEGTRTRSTTLPPLTGCEHVDLSSSLAVTPEKSSASTPSALDTELNIPQEGLESPTGLAASDVKDGSIVLPEGVQLNASAANGLATCSTEQVGFTGFAELNKETEAGVQTPQFTPRLKNPATGEEEATLCPSASRIGNIHIKSPLLEGEVSGGIYQAAPQNYTAGALENPFRSLLALYAVAEEPTTGVLVKFPIKITPSATGQLTGTIESAPQLPFNRLKLEFYGGERAPLATPARCGTYDASLTLDPWTDDLPFSLTEPLAPAITSGPNGTPCPGATLPFAPSLTAGLTSTTAGAFSTLTTSLGREDGQQDLQSTSISFPPGISAVLTGVPECGEAEANAGTCPAASQIGEDTASAGIGQDPYTVTGGRVYLTGPYDGAPFGLSIVTPAKAGPFILQQGAPVVTRAKIEINPTTAQVTVTTVGAIPRIIEGIPLEIQHINVTVNRPNFMLNPTSCEPMSVTGTIGGWEGASSLVSSPFQVVTCASLKFQPTVAAATGAHASKADGASLSFKIAYPKSAVGSQAWFREAKFDIPKQLPARLTTIHQACPQATFEAGPTNCPVHSKIGEAVVHTQVLPEPLKGPLYFVSYGNAKFPDVVMVLSGDNVNIRLTGETFINGKTGVTSATFPNTPDVPFENIEVTLPTGEYSEFGANLGQGKYDFCGQNLKMPTEFLGQNGAAIHEDTAIGISGCAKVKALTRAQKLQKALKACHRDKNEFKRDNCEKAARQKYGPVKAKKKARR